MCKCSPIFSSVSPHGQEDMTHKGDLADVCLYEWPRVVFCFLLFFFYIFYSQVSRWEGRRWRNNVGNEKSSYSTVFILCYCDFEFFFLWPSLEALWIHGRLVTPVNAVLWFFFSFSSLWEDSTSFIVSKSELNWCMSWPEKRDHRKWARLVMKKSHKDGRVTNGFKQDSLFLLIRHTQRCSLSHFLLWAVWLIQGFYGGLVSVHTTALIYSVQYFATIWISVSGLAVEFLLLPYVPRRPFLFQFLLSVYEKYYAFYIYFAAGEAWLNVMISLFRTII